MLPKIPDNKKIAKKMVLLTLDSRKEPNIKRANMLKNKCDKFTCKNIEVINVQGLENDLDGVKTSNWLNGSLVSISKVPDAFGSKINRIAIEMIRKIVMDVFFSPEKL